MRFFSLLTGLCFLLSVEACLRQSEDLNIHSVIKIIDHDEAGTPHAGIQAGTLIAGIQTTDFCEDCPDATVMDEPCFIGLGLCKTEGIFLISTTGERICNAEMIAPQTELCDTGEDEDCDGLIDENFENKDELCEVLIEGQAKQGRYLCSFDRTSLICDTQIDQCDGIDNDFDGEVDENFVLMNVPCPYGSCTESAYEYCIEGQLRNTCTMPESQNSNIMNVDVCDGFDNDCDGRIDENAQSEMLHCGVGSCERLGLTVCLMGQSVIQCTPASPQVEICDQYDNDCDGLTDEGVLNACGLCGLTPNELSCDMIDNDCDGLIDETPPSVELCDMIDNDCDEVIDEGC